MVLSSKHLREQAITDLDAAIDGLRRARADLRTVEERVDWALLAQELGLLDAAIAELTQASNAAPDNPRVTRALARLTQWAEAIPTTLAPSTPPPVVAPTPVEVDDADALLFIHRFAGREGVHARQWVRSKARQVGYSPVAAPITPAVVRAHLRGAITIGSYPIRLDGTVTWAVVDIDLTRKAMQAARCRADVDALKAALDTALQAARQHLHRLMLPTLTVDSGFKGRHLWIFFSTPLPADLVHRLGRQLLKQIVVPAQTHLEFFPKQAKVAPGGLGNLVKLPLGVHRKTGRRCRLLDADGQAIEDPWPALRASSRVSRDTVLSALETLRPGRPATGRPHAPDLQPQGTDPGRPQAPSPAIQQVQAGCPVIARLITLARQTRRLTHDQCVVLIHSLGHLPGGVDTINTLFESCPEVPRHLFLKRSLNGCPISCARIRARIPEITAHEACHCAFSQAAHYPSPVLHGQTP